MKSREVKGSAQCCFTYKRLDSGMLLCDIEGGMGQVEIPSLYLDKSVQEGNGVLDIKYHVRILIDKNSITTDKKAKQEDFNSGVGFPLIQKFNFNTDGESLTIDKGTLDSTSFFDRNPQREYRQLLLNIIDLHLVDSGEAEEIQQRNSKQDWTEDEALVALEAYFKSYKGDQEDLKQAAEHAMAEHGLSRTLDALIFKMLCFRELDPLNHAQGLGNFGSIFKKVWNENAENYRRQFSR